MTLLGYARVSTNGQTLDAQVTQLEAAGCARVFREKVSGAKANRAELKKLVRALQGGDIMVVTRIDRLARSARDLLNIIESAHAKGARFRSLRETWADTTTPYGRLMLTVLAALAEFERELIRERTAEGRARAVAMGVRMGRKPKLDEKQRREARNRMLAFEDIVLIARDYDVSSSTIRRLRCD
jgi:DNA invertase Pin-like site-specific DNA recombinase